jgi:hypothetical protein
MRSKTALAVFLFTLICSPTHARQPIDQARGWRSMTAREQQVYIVGFSEGSFWTWFEASLVCPASSDRIKRVVLESAFGSEAIAGVMTDLYKDPANQFIPPNDLVLIAAKKLRGERIEEDLLQARTRAHNNAKGN